MSEEKKELNTNYKNILDRTRTIVTHHKQLTEAKGELFNIYHILNVKTKEVRTHSAFIAELLNPNGSHLMKDVFLKAFIKFLPKDKFKKHLDYKTTKVTVEYFIDVLDKKKKLGGRIDILVQDINGNSISIENKIDAGDQDDQIERYCNYNSEKNKVVYLSKFGEEPSITSKGELISGEHFDVISYQEEIINWLEVCQKIASDQPILRESIKQYKILIQNITNTLGNQEDKELREIVINNLEEAAHITSKYNNIVFNLKVKFKKRVHEILVEKFPEYKIYNRKKFLLPLPIFGLTTKNQTKKIFGLV